MDDDDNIKPRTSEWPPKELDNMSFEALEEYARILEGEIARVKKRVEAKRDQQSQADSLFQK